MDAALVRYVWQRAAACCEYCGISQEFDDSPFEIDHIIALKHGGLTIASNLALQQLIQEARKEESQERHHRGGTVRIFVFATVPHFSMPAPLPYFFDPPVDVILTSLRTMSMRPVPQDATGKRCARAARTPFRRPLCRI